MGEINGEEDRTKHRPLWKISGTVGIGWPCSVKMDTLVVGRKIRAKPCQSNTGNATSGLQPIEKM